MPPKATGQGCLSHPSRQGFGRRRRSGAEVGRWGVAKR
jgi:hypothetical protein